jgi:glucose/arabinose dehydrogenase
MRGLLAFAVLASLSLAAPALAQSARLERQWPALSFQKPVVLVQAPGDASRFYVVEQAGRILAVDRDPAATRTMLVADLRERVEDGPNEAGLLGIAFHPDFAANRRVFLSYTRAGAPLVSVIARFLMKPDGTLDTASERPVLTLDQPYGNHNGGDIRFGPDGFLYIAFGDGGAAGDPQNNGQNTHSLLGKILRIDVDRGDPYAIPADNPFAAGGGRREIFAWGLRNPWRMAFDRATGELWAADVGQNRLEEIDIIRKGGNYGWNIKEGTSAFRPAGRPLQGLIDPVAEYGRDDGCSVTGGHVYRGPAIPGLDGAYVYGDYCSGRIWALVRGGAGYQIRDLVRSRARISSFAEAADGTLFVLDHGGPVWRIAAP